MKKYKSILIFFSIVIATINQINAQSYDPNFYDKHILYENADLLLLTDYEKLELKNQIQQQKKANNIDSSINYNFDNNDTNNQPKNQLNNKLKLFKDIAKNTYINNTN